jgi:hypothetical protein
VPCTRGDIRLLWLQCWAMLFTKKAYRAVVPIADIGCDSGCAPNTDRQGAVTRAYPDEYLYETLGLVRLAQTTRNFP